MILFTSKAKAGVLHPMGHKDHGLVCINITSSRAHKFELSWFSFNAVRVEFSFVRIRCLVVLPFISEDASGCISVEGRVVTGLKYFDNIES